MRYRTLLTLLLLPFLLRSASAVKIEPLAIGKEAPAWKQLDGTDGGQHSLQDLRDAKAVAIVFTCNQCPVAQAYENRLIKLSKAYADKGVAIVAINVNKNENLDEMKVRAKEKRFPFTYVYDETQEIARQYGAQSTPHVFVLNQARQLVYRGAIDDSFTDEAKVEKYFLREAIDAVLNGTQPEVSETKAVGCGIKWKR